MKKNNIFILIISSIIYLILLTSCGIDNSNIKKITIDNLQYKEIDSYEQDSSCEINPYLYGSNPSLKYVNSKDKLDVEIYLGFPRGKLFGFDFDLQYDDSLIVDYEQEITLTLYKRIEWCGQPTSNKIKRTEPIISEIYSFKEKLGFFLNGDFNKSSKNIKYEDVVTIDELNMNYYDIGSETVLELGENGELYYVMCENYCKVSYYYTLSCDENDYIKYIKKVEQGVIAKTEDGYYNPLGPKYYNDVNTICFDSNSISIKKIDEKIVTFWYNQGVIHYY